MDALHARIAKAFRLRKNAEKLSFATRAHCNACGTLRYGTFTHPGRALAGLAVFRCDVKGASSRHVTVYSIDAHRARPLSRNGHVALAEQVRAVQVVRAAQERSAAGGAPDIPAVPSGPGTEPVSADKPAAEQA
jgi:hypothetical protein